LAVDFFFRTEPVNTFTIPEQSPGTLGRNQSLVLQSVLKKAAIFGESLNVNVQSGPSISSSAGLSLQW
jgi:hypothetical protein